MDKLQSDFPGFRNRYRLIKRIGEGMSTTPPIWSPIETNKHHQEHSQPSTKPRI
jgi:hypothetical protein